LRPNDAAYTSRTTLGERDLMLFLPLEEIQGFSPL
jgi:hypothetical protein